MISDSLLLELYKAIKSKSLIFEYGILNSSSQIEYYLVTRKSLSGKRYENFSILKTGKLPDRIIGFSLFKGIKVVEVFPIMPLSIGHTDYIALTDNNIKFQKTPLITEETLKIHQILLRWVQTPNRKIIKGLELLNIPKEFSICNTKLYRGIIISPEGMNKLNKGQNITLRNNIYESWTHNLEVAKDFALGKGPSKEKGIGIVITYIPKNEVLIDINKFEKDIFGSLKYFSIKNFGEVLLKVSKNMLILTPKQVVFIEKI